MVPLNPSRTKVNALMVSSERFPKEVRLLASPEFRRVFEYKASVADGILVLYAAPNKLARSRIGMAVSRKIGNAVVRNRWKRQLREAFRSQQSQLPEGIDFVVLPRKGATPSHEAVQRSFGELAKKLARKLQGRQS